MVLQEFDYKVTYVEGKANVVADALSRLTTNREVVPVEESLSDVVAMAVETSVGACSKCDYEFDKCGLCGVDKCCECNSTNKDLPAVYCDACRKKLDVSDPIQDVSLMEYLVYGSVTAVKKPSDWERVLKLA